MGASLAVVAATSEFSELGTSAVAVAAATIPAKPPGRATGCASASAMVRVGLGKGVGVGSKTTIAAASGFVVGVAAGDRPADVCVPSLITVAAAIPMGATWGIRAATGKGTTGVNSTESVIALAVRLCRPGVANGDSTRAVALSTGVLTGTLVPMVVALICVTAGASA